MYYKYKIQHISSKFIEFYFLIYDFFIYVFRLNKNNEITSSKIVYLGETFPVRIQRISKLLKENSNFELILLISKKGYEPKLIGNNFDKILVYRNKYHLLNLIQRIKNIKLIHAFEPKAYYQNIILEKKIAPFIYDIQDILINYFGYNTNIKWIKKNLIYEKKILTNSDGFISQSFELNEAFRQYGIKRKTKSLLFPLYCDSKNFKPIKSKLPINKKSIVYIGGINDIKANSSSNFFPFIEKVNSSKISFTIFPAPVSEKQFYNQYKSLESKFEFFKMMKSVPFNSLDLTEFSFGVVPFEHVNSEKYLIKNKYASSMKFFVYLEMGLPIIISNYWYSLAWLVKRYNLGIVTNYNDLNNIDNQINKFDYLECLKNIEIFRNKFDFWKQKDKLINFYNSFLTDKI